ncbi:MAG: zinc ribbon domain-containing protein [bacterium]|nr:zinc ribbon domain-containing protein [bacterium]
MADNTPTEKIDADLLDMLFCPQCGTQIAPEITHCTQCGANLLAAQDTAQSSDPRKADSSQIITAALPEAPAQRRRKAQHRTASLTSQIDYQLSKNYFIPNNINILMVILGILLLLLGLGLLTVRVGIIIIIIGIFILYNEFKKTTSITDQQYDNNAKLYLQNLPEQALGELDLDATEISEASPIIMADYNLLHSNLFKVGKDGILRTNCIQASVIYFSANALHIYTKVFLTTPPHSVLPQQKFSPASLLISESTSEYFYTDIIGVNITTERVRPLKFTSTSTNKSTSTFTQDLFSQLSPAQPQQNTAYMQTFCRLETASGSDVSLCIPNPWVKLYAPNSDQSAKDSIKAMRNLIKEKKASHNDY